MIPEHCSNVSVMEVDFDLTAKSIPEAFAGQKAYIRTDFAVLVQGENFAVARVRKGKRAGKELFQAVQSIEVLSLPADTVYVRDASVDVMNPNSLAQAASVHHGKTVIVEGEFGHVNFIQGERPLNIHVFDLTPPEPAKLTALVRRALGAYRFGRPVVARFEEKRIDTPSDHLRGYAVVYFPCKTAGLSACSPSLTRYLDQPPQSLGPADHAAVVGCPLSLRIYKEVYGDEPGAFENVCPAETAPDSGDGEIRFLKCCKVVPPYVRQGNTVVFPWGVQLMDIVKALEEVAGKAPAPTPREADGASWLTPLQPYDQPQPASTRPASLRAPSPRRASSSRRGARAASARSSSKGTRTRTRRQPPRRRR